MTEDKYKDSDTDEMPRMPSEDSIEATEEVVSQPSQLEIEATEEVQKSTKSLAQEDTTILDKNGEPSKLYEEKEPSKQYEEKDTKPSARILTEETDGEPSREYKDQYIFVWWNKSNGEWNLHHTKPKNLKFRLQIRGASIDDEKLIYGGKIFGKFADFRYNDRQLDYLPMRVNKYSLTPDGEKEKEIRIKCLKNQRN